MNGYVIVKLVGNTSFDGRNFTLLKPSDIESAYGTWPVPDQANVTGVIRNITRAATPDFSDAPDSPGFPDYSDYEPFYGLWIYILYGSVVVLPLIAWVVCAVWKHFVEKHHHAQLMRQRARTPPPQHEGGIELEPVGGDPPAPPPPRTAQEAIRAAQLQEWEASPWEQAVVLFFMFLWRGI
ncbi:hypothetical protein PG997_005940 [Apiospora hydei]|uniref:Uncharacterized protein n=1 Tax=Apiospora hydei TaxID=1337664 RepID=A0ABR1WMA5_9PEZI